MLPARRDKFCHLRWTPYIQIADDAMENAGERKGLKTLSQQDVERGRKLWI